MCMPPVRLHADLPAAQSPHAHMIWIRHPCNLDSKRMVSRELMICLAAVRAAHADAL